MKKFIPFLILSLIIITGIITRYYKLGNAPAGLYVDEAGQGYSAYSILKTGKDEFGKVYPVIFRSFTDFKTPVYIYLIVPLIPLFGLSTFTVRLPSFIFSILTLPLLYLLIKELAPKKIATKLALLSSFLLAISPWHILFGRTTFECNVALFFLLGGIYFFQKALKNPKLILLSSLFFAISVPAYHAQRIVTPLIVLVLFLKHKKLLLNKTYKTWVIGAIIIGVFLTLPTFSVINTPGFLARASVLSIFSSNQLSAGYIENQTLLNPIVNNNIFLKTREFLSLYINYFSPRSMFVLGDSGPRSSYPELSTFFPWQLPFYLYGLYLLFKSKNLGDLKFVTISLLIISPLPAAVTRDPYSTIRSLQMVIPLTIIIALGIIKAYEKLHKYSYKIISVGAFVILIFYSLTKLYSSGIILNEYLRADEWHYGWEQVAKTIANVDLPIIVDNSRLEPYSQLVFFLKIDPEKYQKENFEVEVNKYYTNLNRNRTKIFNNIITRPIDWEKDLLKEQYLVGDSLSISHNQIKEHNLELVKEIIYPDGSPAFRIVKTN